MKVQDVFQEVDKLLNKEVSVEGFFIMSAGVGYLVETKDEKENTDAAIGINMQGLDKIMYGSVPAYGGSKFSYLGWAKISGILSGDEFGEFKINLTNITHMEIEVSGEMFYPISRPL